MYGFSRIRCINRVLIENEDTIYQIPDLKDLFGNEEEDCLSLSLERNKERKDFLQEVLDAFLDGRKVDYEDDMNEIFKRASVFNNKENGLPEEGALSYEICRNNLIISEEETS
jgi:hypothetical protein